MRLQRFRHGRGLLTGREEAIFESLPHTLEARLHVVVHDLMSFQIDHHRGRLLAQPFFQTLDHNPGQELLPILRAPQEARMQVTYASGVLAIPRHCHRKSVALA
jgi:hypothetical protein